MLRTRLMAWMFVIMFVSFPISASDPAEPVVVEKFGVVFEETVIADASDDLEGPTDLEFHPGRTNELWIANQDTDSMTIVHNTGMENQTSENREDAYSNHFLEEVSAIAFGSYHPEFDWQWGSAQETANTYCGQGAPNNFMGPTLWPSALTHYAVENQNNNLLGSHIDMNHESPFGVGIAHDHDNVYWYNDGYYGELVMYDFAEDHDTGYDDHSDAIVHRYTEVEIGHLMGVPGHMVLDKSTGILYIADPADGRVLWVNTDDATTTSVDMMGHASRMEPLAEYENITSVEWGVLASGLDRPSGIALDDGELYVSQNGNGAIVAYDLATDGKSGVALATIQTTAVSIMGLEVGPNGHLYYVDHGMYEVVRIDPYDDTDGDGVGDLLDNCPYADNPLQTNFDNDSAGDVCDDDDDNDAVLDAGDRCVQGVLNWTSTALTDHDGDGCLDTTEDVDDDDDGVADASDICSTGVVAWSSNATTDYDGDGCYDATEDDDDDNDRICDAGEQDNRWSCTTSSTGMDQCPTSSPGFSSYIGNDADADGCDDATEDTDDDNDGFNDDVDACPNVAGNSSLGASLGCSDYDGDGYGDTVDAFPTEVSQWFDADSDGFGDQADGFQADACPDQAGDSSMDRFGCADGDGDGWSNANDAFPQDSSQHADNDNDGYGDNSLGVQADACPSEAGTSTLDRLGCIDSDNDGYSDDGDAFPNEATQHSDRDGDGFGDNATGERPDACSEVPGTSTQQTYGCPDSDGDGWEQRLDAFDDDPRLWSDGDGDGFADQNGTTLSDDCPEEFGTSTEDRLGCLDGDGDGWSDEADLHPNDATKHLEDESMASQTQLIGGGVALLVLVLLVMLVAGRRRSSSLPTMAMPKPTVVLPMPTVAPQATVAGPPLPPEGLPAGWTMEQWAWYGEDYLKNR